VVFAEEAGLFHERGGLPEHKRVASNATHDWQHLLLRQDVTVVVQVYLPSTFIPSSTKNNSVQPGVKTATETISDYRRTSADSAEGVQWGISRHFCRSYLKSNLK